MEDEVDPEIWLAEREAEAQRRSFFCLSLMNPSFHWFFTQGQQALELGLYIPGVSALLNGIEASLRVTMAQLEPDYLGDKLELSPYQNLSNTLLRKGRDSGLPVELLKLQEDEDFLAKIDTKEYVQIVQLRHDVCHGNILNFRQRMEFEQIDILTPECLRQTAAKLLVVSYSWAVGLATFRAAHGRRPEGFPIPEVPLNPLGKWL